MKKLILLAITAILSLNLYSQIYWEKHPDNPVLTRGEAGTWDDESVAIPCVLIIDNVYHMWYSGAGSGIRQIGHATSNDGISWTKDPLNPVLKNGASGSWDSDRAYFPEVYYKDGTFHMWYIGATASSVETMGYATSADGTVWTKYENNPVFESGNPGEWDAGYLGPGAVYYEGDLFNLFYGASPNNSSQIIRMGLATSPDGINWTRDAGNPLIESAPQGSWDYPRVQASSVIKDETGFKMWYAGGAWFKWQIGYATSEDGISWNRSPRNPVLDSGESGTWDSKQVSFPSVLYDATRDVFKMWYCGGKIDYQMDIGYAESDARLPALWVKNKTLVDNTDILVAEINKDGIIHLVPYGTSPVIDSINKYSLASTDVLANTEVNVPLIYLPVGQYMVVAVSNGEFVSPNPFLLIAVPDASLPELTIAEDTVSGATITATSTKDGILYLLKSPMPPDLSLVRNPNFLVDSLAAGANVPVEFPTSGLIKNILYWIYAVDIYGQFSERGIVRVEQGVGVKENANAGIRIYPNPANDLLTIETGIVGHRAIEINSLNGQLIYSTKMEGTSHQIDLSPFERGIYFITVRSKDFITTRKIIKM